MNKEHGYNKHRFILIPLICLYCFGLITGCVYETYCLDYVGITDCPTFELVEICEPFLCSAHSEFPEGIVYIDFYLPTHSYCTPIDCTTVQCDDWIFENIHFDEYWFLNGTVTIGRDVVEFSCY